MHRHAVRMLFAGGCLLWPALASAGSGEVPFQTAFPLEVRSGDYFQNGNPVEKKSMEADLGETVPESQQDMSAALRLRRGGRICLFIGLPLLVGGVATAIVASSGTVGSAEGTMAVYGVSLGLTGTSLVLDVVAAVLLVKSRRRYEAAVEGYNRRFGGGGKAGLDVRFRVAGNGLLLSVAF